MTLKERATLYSAAPPALGCRQGHTADFIPSVTVRPHYCHGFVVTIGRVRSKTNEVGGLLDSYCESKFVL